MLMTNTRLDTTVHSSTVVVTGLPHRRIRKYSSTLETQIPQMGKKIRYHTRRLSRGRETRCRHSSSRYMTDCTATIITTRVAEGSSAADIFRGRSGNQRNQKNSSSRKSDRQRVSSTKAPMPKQRLGRWLVIRVDRSGSAIR